MLRQNNSWLPWKRPGKVGQSCCCCYCHPPGFLLTLGYSQGGPEICIDVWGCPELSPVWEGPAFWKLLLPGACKGEDGTDPPDVAQKLRIRWGFRESPWGLRGEPGLSFWGETRVRAKLGQQAVPLVGGQGTGEIQGSSSPSRPWCRSHIGGEGVPEPCPAQWPPPMTAHLGAQCALGLWPRAAPPSFLHNGGHGCACSALPRQPTSWLPGPTKLGRVSQGSHERFRSRPVRGRS